MAEGGYIFGGAPSGVVYIWEASRGRLLVSLPAHYKAVSSISVSSCGSYLITGGEDSVVNVWELMHILDAGR